MPYHIDTLHTYSTTASFVRGIAFNNSPNIWLGGPSDNVLEQMVQATGAVVADHPAGVSAWLVLYDPIQNQFWTTSAGSGASAKVSRFNGSGTLIDNPTVGNNPYGQCIANGHYWCANTGSDSVTVLDAATGAFLATIGGLVGGPSNGIGAVIFDGTSIWIPTQNSRLYRINEVSHALTLFTPASVGNWGGMVFALGSLWATDTFTFNLVKLDLAGNVLNLFPTFAAGPICFDGTNFWILDFSGTVAVMSPTGQNLTNTFASGVNGQWIASDPFNPGLGQAWVTSNTGTPGKVQLFQLVFVPPPPEFHWANVAY